jgi:hypothetical protein
MLINALAPITRSHADDTIRWTVSVSKKTDIAVRSYLAQRGMKKGDLSKFIEEAVKWRVLDQTMTEARSKFGDMPAAERESLIDEAVAAVRKDKTSKANSARDWSSTLTFSSAPCSWKRRLSAHRIVLWREGRFDLLASAEEVGRTDACDPLPKNPGADRLGDQRTAWHRGRSEEPTGTYDLPGPLQQLTSGMRSLQLGQAALRSASVLASASMR